MHVRTTRPTDTAPDTPQDAELDLLLETRLVAAGRGDRVAAAAVYDEMAPRVHGLAVQALGDGPPAVALTREVFGRLWRGDHADGPGSAAARVLALAHRTATERRRALDPAHHGHELPAGGLRHDPFDADAASADLGGRTVAWALAALSPSRRAALDLAWVGGHTHAEVDRILQVPAGVGASLIREGLAGLRAMVAVEIPAPSGLDEPRVLPERVAEPA